MCARDHLAAAAAKRKLRLRVRVGAIVETLVDVDAPCPWAGRRWSQSVAPFAHGQQALAKRRGDDRSAFPQAPESMCDGKQIRVPGEVCEHDGRAQIEVAAPLRSRSWSTTRNPNAWRPGRRRSVKGA